MKKIKLTQGKYALVDEADFECLNQFKWHYNFYGYAVCNSVRIGNYTYMHRLLLGLQKGDKKEGDHINHNKLDNRRCNLRICTKQQNLWNMESKTGVSKYKGVHLNKRSNKWYAQLQTQNGRYIGSFNLEIEAAKAYDKKAKEIFGEFAKLNFPE